MKITIDHAIYGASQGGTAVDVTSKVQSLFDGATGNAVSILVATSTFGIADPAPGVRKSLVVRYKTTNDLGATSSPVYRMGVEGDTISVPCQGIAVVQALEAIYGTPDQFVDITESFNHYLALNPGSGAVTVGAKDFLNFFCSGSDPAYGIAKTLYLHLSFSGLAEPTYLCGNDGETVSWTVG